MAYCTIANVKGKLVFEYWKSIVDFLVQEGFACTNNAFLDEDVFIQTYIDKASDFINAYCNGPFVPNGVLNDANSVLAIFEIEQFFLSGQSDRQVNITLVYEKKRVLTILDKINSNQIYVLPADNGAVGTESRAPSLIAPNCVELMGGVQGSDCFDFLEGCGYA